MDKLEQFCDAVWAGDLPTVEAMIAAGVDVNAAPADGRSRPLHLAIEQQRVEIVRQLIKAGADVNLDLGEGWTPLEHAIDIESDAAWQAHQATGCETTELSELLLASGAVPTKRAFEEAASYNNQRALELLRRHEGRP